MHCMQIHRHCFASTQLHIFSQDVIWSARVSRIEFVRLGAVHKLHNASFRPFWPRPLLRFTLYHRKLSIFYEFFKHCYLSAGPVHAGPGSEAFFAKLSPCVTWRQNIFRRRWRYSRRWTDRWWTRRAPVPPSARAHSLSSSWTRAVSGIHLNENVMAVWHPHNCHKSFSIHSEYMYSSVAKFLIPYYWDHWHHS